MKRGGTIWSIKVAEFKNNIWKTYSDKTVEQLVIDDNIINIGLTPEQVIENRKIYGNNEGTKVRFNYFWSFVKNYLSFFNLILISITIFNLFQYIKEPDFIDLLSIIIISIMILISGTIGFVQELNSFLIRKKIIFKNKKYVRVIRGLDLSFNLINENNINNIVKQAILIPNDELVYGDIVYLSVGDVVAADAKLIYEKNLSILQASLSGEPFPVDKSIINDQANMIDFDNICYAGTIVSTGYALARVFLTGKNTFQINVNSKIKDDRRKSTFDKCMAKVSAFILCFMLITTPIIMLFSYYTGNDFAASLLFTISMAVGLTPEMLPIIITLNLNRGFKKLTNSCDANIKNIDSIQAVGSMDVLCMDKTGTITEGEVSLHGTINYYGKNDMQLQMYAFINANYQSGFENPIDTAIIKKLDINKPSDDEIKVINEKPFDFDRRLLSVLVKYNDVNVQITKGATDEILKFTSKILIDGKILKFEEKHRVKIEKEISDYNEKGFRVIALGIRENVNKIEETDFTFIGLLIFFDKPKKETKKLIKNLIKRKVECKILTGDSEIVTRQIAEMAGFEIKGVISGPTLDRLTDDQFDQAVRDNNIFVKLNPLLKTKIVTRIQSFNKLVGFIGDGINDVSVLRAADVGISFRDASIPAKQAADIVIDGNKLTEIDTAITNGRNVLCNILKYLNITLASNLGNTITIMIAILWFKFSPMQPVQILVQNLLYDFTQFALIIDKVDNSYTSKPRTIKIKHMLLFMLFMGPLSSVFDMITFVITSQIYGYDGSSVSGIQLFNSCWFPISLLTQVTIIYVLKTDNINIFKQKRNIILNISCGIISALALIITFVKPIGNLFQISPPPASYLLFIVLIVVCYVLATMLVKYLFIKSFKSMYA